MGGVAADACGLLESAMTVSVSDLLDITIDTHVDGASPGLKGVVGMPEGHGPWPAVVVLHEAFGVDEEMRKQVAHLASLGYLALMPDLFTSGGMVKCIRSTMKALQTGTGRAYRDIEAARLWLAARDDTTPGIGAIGFCMGGGFAIMTVADFDVSAVNYGILPKDLDAAFEHSCPVVASYGGRDVTLRGAARKIEVALTRHGVEHDVKEYPDAGHVFLNEKLTGPLWARPIMRVMNFGPRPASAADAWHRIDTFLRAHLAPTHERKE